jgi:hypothetical protein
MSDIPDDLFPVVGCVRREDARRRVGGRTLVNLNTVDFAPVLIPLQCVAESARQCAGLIAPDGIVGNAWLRLRSQLDERWGAFETAVVSAGLVSEDFTPNTLLLTCDGEPPMVEQLQEVVCELWDLISHHRRGRFDGADGLDMLAKQSNATAALVQALTPSETPPAESTPTADTDDWKVALAFAADDNALAMVQVAQDATKSADEQMRAIYTIEQRALGWTSPRWAKLLGVTDAAVRQTRWWRIDRPRLRG